MSPEEQALTDVRIIETDNDIDLNGQMDYTSSIDVANRILACQKLDEKIDELRASRDQTAEFYNRRMKTLEERIGFYKGEIAAFLEHNRTKNVITHHGTATLVKREAVTYGKDVQRLLDWINDKQIPDGVTTVATIKPNMPAIREYVAQTADYPPEYSCEIKETVQIRKVTP